MWKHFFHVLDGSLPCERSPYEPLDWIVSTFIGVQMEIAVDQVVSLLVKIGIWGCANKPSYMFVESCFLTMKCSEWRIPQMWFSELQTMLKDGKRRRRRDVLSVERRGMSEERRNGRERQVMAKLSQVKKKISDGSSSFK